MDENEYTKVLEPKEELQYLSQVLGFQVTYTDFPQKANNKTNTAVPEFITLVKLSTKPPKVSKKKLAYLTSSLIKWQRESSIGGGGGG